MGTETKSPLPTAANPIEAGLSYAGMMNQYKETDPELQRNIDAREAGLQALESRYENPNWFNVAAGFAKPQLGGFTASLGSAAQALGDWQEQQRANQIPIYNARAQVALLKNKQAHRQTAANLYQNGVENGFTKSQVDDIVGHDPENFGPQALAAYKQQLENVKAGNAVSKEQFEAGTKPGVSAAVANLYGSTLGRPDVPGEGLRVPSNASLGDSTSPVNTGAPAAGAPASTNRNFVMPAGVGGGTSAATTGITNENIAKGNAHALELTDAANGAQERIANLASIYPVLSKPKVMAIMGRTENGSVQAALTTALANQSVSGAVGSVASMIIPPGTDAATAADIRQVLTAAAKEQLAVNKSTPHPTLTTQNVEKNAAFSILDPSPAAMRNIRLTLHDLQLPIQLAPIANSLAKKGTAYPDMVHHPEYQSLVDAYQQRHSDIANGKITNKLPVDLDPNKGAFRLKGKTDLASQIGLTQ